jgi:hypothetical protein
MQDPGLVAEIHGSERRHDVQSTETGGPGASAITSFSQISSSTSRARSPASHAPGGGDLLLGRPGFDAEFDLGPKLRRDLVDGTPAAKLKHYRVERAPASARQDWSASVDLPQPGSPWSSTLPGFSVSVL